MTVRCRAGQSPGARSRCHSHTRTRLSGRQPGQATRGTAPLISEPESLCAWRQVCLRSSTTARKGRREEYRLCPPTPSLQASPGTLAGACNRSCCAAASTTSTGPPANCCTATPPSTSPGGVLPIACKTRRASRCPACAEVYRADTYQLIRAGLTGGKGIPDAVATHPCVFTTLTAPSFGPVHAHRDKDGRTVRCRPRRRVGPAPTAAAYPAARGTPAMTPSSASHCPDCYDYTGAVLFNAYAPELWRRFTITVHRTLARRAGVTNKALAAQARVSYAKVAEYQQRGVVHFHAIIRLDGPAGPTTAPPSWATLELLTAAIAQAASAVHLEIPVAPGLPARTLHWGREHDIRPITTTEDLTDTKVAAYVAKYATKTAECTGTLDRRITPADQLAELPIREHARRHIAECIRLGKLPALEDLRLVAWAHMLGFNGHLSTKSRTYSTTLGALRADRAQYQREHAIAAGLLPDLGSETTLVLPRWHFAGRGHAYRPTPGDTERPGPP
jgi:hypothetical protein